MRIFPSNGNADIFFMSLKGIGQQAVAERLFEIIL